ncbi:MAG: hypothetical protein RL115_1690 [Bacteroidota bacterium]
MWLMSNRITAVQVCDARDDAQGTEAGNKKISVYLC